MYLTGPRYLRNKMTRSSLLVCIFFLCRIFCVIRNHPPGKPQDRKASSLASCTEGQRAHVPFQLPPQCTLEFLHQRHGNNINGLLHLTAIMSWMFTAYIDIFLCIFPLDKSEPGSIIIPFFLFLLERYTLWMMTVLKGRELKPRSTGQQVAEVICPEEF